MTAVTVTFMVEVSDESVETLIEEAGYMQTGWNMGGYIDSENRMFRCTVDDGEEMFEKSCTYDDIIKTMEFMAIDNPRLMADLMFCYQGGDFAGEMDAEDYDSILQTALFGEVVYG